MSTLREWGRRVWYLLNRSRYDDVLRSEMEEHRARMGDPRSFGNTLRLREDARDVWGWRWLDDVARDTRFAWRAFVRNPGFSLVAVVSLALATGATTAIFSIVSNVLLEPLPLGEPEHLVQVYGRMWREDRGTPDPIAGPVAPQHIEVYRRESRSVEGLAGFAVSTRHLAWPSGPERLMAVVAHREFFGVLKVEPLLGRTFIPDDGLDVAVISARLWRERFDGDPSVAGRSVLLDGRPFTIVGVMPDAFQFPYRAASLLPGALPESRTDVWLPAESTGQGRMSVVARLRPGVSIPAAEAELRLIAARLEKLEPNPRFRVGVRLQSLSDVVLGPVRGSLWMLFAAVGLVLAAACANVANLMLARMTARVREVATRAVLGADGRRLVRQFIAESLLLSIAGGALGVAIASWGLQALGAAAAPRIPRAHEIALDWQAFAFLLSICVATALLFGLAPALSASRVDVHTAARDGGGQSTIAGRYGRLRDALVSLQVALAFVLAFGAAAVVSEVERQKRTPTGMATENVLTLHLTPRAEPQDYYAIEQRIAGLPAVRAAGLTQLVPLQNWGWFGGFTIRGRTVDAPASAELRYVTPGYFAALGIPVVQGRPFAHSDVQGAAPVVVVNEALVRRYFPNEDPVGRILDRGTIVGVVGDVRNVRLDRPAEPEIYYPVAQNVAMTSDAGMSLIVRTSGPPEGLTDAIRAAVREVRPTLAVFNVKTMDRVLAESMWELNLYRWLIGLFAGLALAVAVIGLYGVISYNVTSRLREFAVRLALGAEPAAVSRLVFRRAVRLAAAGVAAGTALTVVLAPLVADRIPAAAAGPGMYAVVCGLLVALALAACSVPALRVARVNPAAALRHE